MKKTKKKETATKVEFGYTEKPEILSKPVSELENIFVSTCTVDDVEEAAEERAGEEIGGKACCYDSPVGMLGEEPSYEDVIRYVCADMQEILLRKNASYGGAAFRDVTLAGMHVSAEKAILVRMSDKIRRLQEGTEYEANDQILDLAGYCLLLQAVRLYKMERGE